MENPTPTPAVNPFYKVLLELHARDFAQKSVYAAFLEAVSGFESFARHLKSTHERVTLGQNDPSFALMESMREAEEIADFEEKFAQLVEDLPSRESIANAAHDDLQDQEPDYYHNVYAKGNE